jgi:cystathionine gamma-synthase
MDYPRNRRNGPGRQKGPQSHRESLRHLPLDRFANFIDVPIYRAVNYHFKDIAEIRGYHEGTRKSARYGRYHNLTCEYAEQLIANLEGCEAALLFSSGMSALATSVFALCSKGDHIIFGSNCYLNISRLCREVMPRFGISTTGVSTLRKDFISEVKRSVRDNTRMVIVETPSNPHLQLVDLAALKRALQEFKNTLLVVDGTLASPYNLRPAEYGADLVMQSCTKYLSGGGNVMAGSMSGAAPLVEKIRVARNTIGGIVSPEDAYLLTHGIYTLTPRMEYYNRAGLQMASFLAGHPRVKQVYYTGLASHPQHRLAARMLRGHGGVVTFEPDAPARAVSRFVEGLKVPFMATHFGSPFTTIEQYGIFTLYHFSQAEKEALGVNDRMIRMSLGFDDFDLLCSDLKRGLDAL